MTQHFECWVGMDLVDATDDEIAEFNDFYDSVHVHEVLARYGFSAAGRFELIGKPTDVDAPHWLAIYEIADNAGVESFRAAGQSGDRTAGFSPGPPVWCDRSRRRTTWRMLWNPLFESSAYCEEPDGIYVVGMNAPGADSPRRLAEFNEFYNTVHGPEVLRHRSSRRLRRYCLREVMQNAYGNSAQFAAVYDMDRDRVQALIDGTVPPRDARAAIFSGPLSWQTHDTCWRLSYRLISATPAELS